MIYNELMSDFEMDEKDFAADSWSLAVDGSFLQQHKKEVMKQQDVIYGELSSPDLCLFSPGPTDLCPFCQPLPLEVLSLLIQWAPHLCLISPCCLYSQVLVMLFSRAPSLLLFSLVL